MKKSGWMSKEKAQQQSINYNKIHGFVISLEKIESLLLSLRLFYGEPQKFFHHFSLFFQSFSWDITQKIISDLRNFLDQCQKISYFVYETIRAVAQIILILFLENYNSKLYTGQGNFLKKHSLVHDRILKKHNVDLGNSPYRINP
jgi:hypothetical protein